MTRSHSRNVCFSPVIALVLAALPTLSTAAGPPGPDPQYHVTGYWEAPYDWGFAGIHSILLHGAGDSHSQVLVYNTGPIGAVWKVNPMDSLSAGSLTPVSTINSNIFCGGHSVMKDGRALITGGNEYSDQGQDHVNIFDPLQSPPGYVSPRPRNMFNGRYYPTNVALSDGSVLVMGGREYQEFVGVGGLTTDGYSNGTTVLGLRGTPLLVNTVTGGTPPVPRAGHTACFDSLRNDQTHVGYRFRQRTIVFGGEDESGNVLNDVHALYRDELAQWTWQVLNPGPDPVWGYPVPRTRHAAMIEGVDSSLVVYGGLDGTGAALDDVWKLHLYRGADGTWERLFPTGGDSTVARWGHTVHYDASQDRLLVFGGRSNTQAFNDVLALALDGAPAWTRPAVLGSPPAPRDGHAALLDRDRGRNRLLVFGGLAADGSPLGDLWELDLSAAPTWSALAATPDPSYGTPAPRGRHAGVYDPVYDRWVLYGGDTNGILPGGLVGDLWHLRLSGAGVPQDEQSPQQGVSETPTWTRLYDSVTGQGVAGHAAVFDTRWLNSSLPELFYPAFDFWQPLYSGLKWIQLYPFMFLLPNGRVFYAGPEFETWLFDVENGTWMSPPWNVSFLGGSAVQYRPGKIMKCGDQGVVGLSDTAVIDFTADPDSIGWRMTGLSGPMLPRVEHNLTLLPTGQVLVSGGLSQRTSIAFAERRPQIWDPVTEQYTSPGLLASDPMNRDYHSTALLLPDGRVLSTGGEGKTSPTDRGRLTATIYWPPYLFDENGAPAARPVIAGNPDAVAWGNTFLVDCPQAASIASVCLMRPGAVTHAFNQDQRYIPLPFTMSAGNWLRVTAPPDGHTAPPGYYLLFVVTADSVPSVGSWIQVGTPVTGVPEGIGRLPLAAAPNPLATATHITFGLPVAQRVTVTVFDASGRRIRDLADGWRDGGMNDVAWDARDDRDAAVPNGVYFVRVTTGVTRRTLKLTVAR